MGSLLEGQMVKSEESAANQLVGAAVELFMGGTLGSQMEVDTVVGLALGTVEGIVLVASEQWLEWQ